VWQAAVGRRNERRGRIVGQSNKGTWAGVRRVAGLLFLAAMVVALTPSDALARDYRTGDSSYRDGNNSGDVIYALTTANQLLGIDSNNPTDVRSRVTITGIKPGERVVGMDFRPANGQLYGIGSTSQVYTINPQTGVATAVGAPFTPALSGTEFGVDFNPVVDRIRIVSDAGQNLRVNPDTGAIAGVDGNLAYAAGDRNAGRAPQVTGAAYANNMAGVTTTVLYDIDAGLDIVARQDPPNAGTLNTNGSLGVDTGSLVGFDIASGGRDYNALAALQVNGQSRLYSVDLDSGRARDRGRIGNGEAIRDIAIPIGNNNGGSYGGGGYGGYGGYGGR